MIETLMMRIRRIWADSSKLKSASIRQISIIRLSILYCGKLERKLFKNKKLTKIKELLSTFAA